MRDPVKVAKEMAERNEVMIEKAFELFADNTIEAVSMNQVADASGVGIATLYRYYPTKQKLVLKVAEVKWREFAVKMNEMRPFETIPQFDAIQRVELFLDVMIYWYKNDQRILKFSYNFDSYAKHENISTEELKGYFEALSPVDERFYMMLDRAEEDHSVREDLTEKDIIYSVVYPMMEMASKFCYGIVWPDWEMTEEDCVHALERLKMILMDYCRA